MSPESDKPSSGLLNHVKKIIYAAMVMAAVGAVWAIITSLLNPSTPKDATVILDGCEPMDHPNCVFKGMLSAGQPFDGYWELEMEDGRIMHFSDKQIAMMSWKVPE